MENAIVRQVYFSDLSKILELYKNNFSSSSDFYQGKLTEDFGLPLSLMEFNKNIVGFASVTLSELNQPLINCYFEKGFGNNEDRLMSFAEKVFASRENASENGFTRLKIYIDKLTEWIIQYN